MKDQKNHESVFSFTKFIKYNENKFVIRRYNCTEGEFCYGIHNRKKSKRTSFLEKIETYK